MSESRTWRVGADGRNQVIAACGNGSLRLFDITLEVSLAWRPLRRASLMMNQGLPVKAWHEHSAEIMSVDWNNLEKDRFATSSWDQTVKIASCQNHTLHRGRSTDKPK